MGQSGLNLVNSIFLKGVSQSINVCCHSLARDHEFSTSTGARNIIYDIDKMGEYLYHLIADQIKNGSIQLLEWAPALGQDGCALPPCLVVFSS